MRRSVRLLLWTALSVVLVAIVGFGGALTYVSFVNERRLAIESPRGINEAMYVSIGGIDQWIQIRGQDRDNPVLLCLNGGPGFSIIPATAAFLPWEREFTMVMWDQRGEGETFERSGPSVARTMTMDRMAKDGIEVAEFLRSHLQRDKIILLGHSWGSMLGLRMAAQRPDLFSAYVGTGQNVDLRHGTEIGYPVILAKAHSAGITPAISDLERVGPPPYTDLDKYWVLVGWENRLDGPAPRRTLLGLVSMTSEIVFRSYLARGARFSQGLMLPAMLDEDASKVATRFELPIFLFQGESDIITPTVLAREYFDRIEAPRKEFVTIPGAGHLAVFAKRDIFLKELVTRVRPLAVSP